MGSNEKSVSAATIAVSAGVSAVVSAIVVTIGVIGMILIDDGNDSPTVVTALPAQVAAAAPAPAAAPAAAETTAPETTAAPSSAQVPVAAPQEVAGQAAAPQQAAATQEAAPAAAAPAAAAPVALSEGELVGKLQFLLSGAAPDAKAAEIQGGAAGIPTIDAVAGALNAAGAVYKWTIDGPVTIDGDVMTAQLRTSLIGFPDRTQPISWRWIDGAWKLSNESVCALAANAMATCTV